jgi:G3E family GTPase
MPGESMKIAQIAGFLGSGKTTFLIEVSRELVNRGHRIAIVVNDVGDINVDAKFIESYGLKAKEISGGCICCQIAGSFATTVATLHKTFKPDIIIVEPSGVAIPWGLKRAAEYSEEEMDAKIEHAPVVTLVDALRIEELLASVRRLVETQIREADIVFINKVDAASQDKIRNAVEFVKVVNPRAEIMYGSGRTGQGVKEIATAMETRLSPRYDEASEAEILRKEYASKE